MNNNRQALSVRQGTAFKWLMCSGILVSIMSLSACTSPGGSVPHGQTGSQPQTPAVVSTPEPQTPRLPSENLPPAPYELGHIVAQNDSIYREFWGMTERGYYIVQDFYNADAAKRSELYVMMRLDEVHQLLLDASGTAPQQYAALTQTGIGIEGPYVQWYASGNKAIEGYYERGLPQRQWTLWYENGKMMLQETLVDGVRHGEAKGWHDNGRPAGQGSYAGGVRQGRWTVWYPNGAKLQEGNYENGQQQGEWNFWYENGRRKEAGSFNQGVRVGPWSWWTREGELAREADYGADGQALSTGRGIGSGTIQPRGY